MLSMYPRAVPPAAIASRYRGEPASRFAKSSMLSSIVPYALNAVRRWLATPPLTSTV